MYLCYIKIGFRISLFVHHFSYIIDKQFGNFDVSVPNDVINQDLIHLNIIKCFILYYALPFYDDLKNYQQQYFCRQLENHALKHLIQFFLYNQQRKYFEILHKHIYSAVF